MKTVIIGGFVDYEIQMSRSLNKQNDSMVYIYTKDTCLLPENEKLGEGLKIRLLSRPGAIYNPIVLAHFLVNSYRMLKEIRQYDPDVVHFQIGSSMLAFYMPFLRKYPIVTTFHDLKPHSGEVTLWEKYLHRYIRRRSDYLLVHGDGLQETMIREYRQPASKVRSIPIGPHNIDAFKFYENKDLKEDGNMVLFFGRILEYKGLEYLIKAEPYITKEIPDARIVIAGSGDQMDKYERLMVNKDRFEVYHRYIPYTEGAGLFQRASVIVLPYVEASQSGVVSTAYGFKKPVVVTNIGSIPEIVDEGITGLVVPARDPEALAKAIVRLLKDERSRLQMGANAYKKLNTDLSWDRVVEKTMGVYREAVNGHRKGKGRDINKDGLHS
ncbi:MAG TPA: glycosyltransferase family 4 protein [Methanocellaceae archaeon]